MHYDLKNVFLLMVEVFLREKEQLGKMLWLVKEKLGRLWWLNDITLDLCHKAQKDVVNHIILIAIPTQPVTENACYTANQIQIGDNPRIFIYFLLYFFLVLFLHADNLILILDMAYSNHRSSQWH